jgi:hypothetical protein
MVVEAVVKEVKIVHQIILAILEDLVVVVDLLQDLHLILYQVDLQPQ